MLAFTVHAALLTGCADVDGPIADDAPADLIEAEPEETDGLPEERHPRTVTWRNDQTAELNVFEGPWGSWSNRLYCNERTFAIGFKLRVESSQGGGDDTALNAIELVCADRARVVRDRARPHEGHYGNWGADARCAAGFMRGARLRVEAPQNGGDDTGANDVQGQCSASGNISSNNGMGYGTWRDWQSCAQGTAVCGAAIQIEPKQGEGDDTSMNGLRLYCCRL